MTTDPSGGTNACASCRGEGQLRPREVIDLTGYGYRNSTKCVWTSFGAVPISVVRWATLRAHQENGVRGDEERYGTRPRRRDARQRRLLLNGDPRFWVAIDIWEGAIDQVRARLEQSKQLLRDPDPQVRYTLEPPVRTDNEEIAAPNLRIQLKRAREPWEKLSHAQMRTVLVGAQAAGELVICAGCGRDLESEFMELDHLHPKDDNGADHVVNRILLCRPCNGRKSNQLTMAGLRRQNRKAGWMKDASRSEYAQRRAVARTTWVSENWEHRREVGLE